MQLDQTFGVNEHTTSGTQQFSPRSERAHRRTNLDSLNQAVTGGTMHDIPQF